MLPKAWWAVYVPVGAAAGGAIFAEGIIAHPQFETADVIIALDCDFLGAETTVQMAQPVEVREV